MRFALVVASLTAVALVLASESDDEDDGEGSFAASRQIKFCKKSVHIDLACALCVVACAFSHPSP